MISRLKSILYHVISSVNDDFGSFSFIAILGSLTFALSDHQPILEMEMIQ
jgi:hypothetical protein